MIEFDYDLDYKNLDFKPNDTRYRIGRGEQGVLLVRPYTDDICIYWKFRTPKIAEKSSRQIYHMYLHYKKEEDFVGMDMCRKFLEMGFTRARRYANHRDGKKYDKFGNVKPQEKDALTCDKAISATIFFALVLNFTEPFKFNLTIDLFISMSWLILMVSIGAISILMLLISRGKMSSTASLFFLAPPVSAILGYFIFKEELNTFGIIGFIITCTGVWLVNREVKKY